MSKAKAKYRALKMPVRYIINTVLVVLVFLGLQLVSQNQALRADERQAQRAKSQAFRTTDGWGRGPDNWRWQMRE